MSHNKYNITIEYSHGGNYKVSLSDHHGSRTVVYEPSVAKALQYAKQWCEEADERKHAKDVMNNAIMEAITLDRIAGITTNNRDGLD